ncbi:Dehydrodolichyl diphosphate syntase complex subunit SPAC4D7.04c [Grifola frondosa]|uniref:Dehydrodolichyl diphosphate syntase complex subunit SPAC4D7.04c n=1 Tax=Grifola frondosa TaxID=5627 RepID=A0A1C7LWS5_GRIFR|nr:Dehydrodolichyl diphosphate syntase complex subunit SPAC4D7.04c [Grifola frondosa]
MWLVTKPGCAPHGPRRWTGTKTYCDCDGRESTLCQATPYQNPRGTFGRFHGVAADAKVCLRLNVRCVSAYAFAIENFKRSPEEVEALMALAEEKLLEIVGRGTCWMNMVYD